MKVTITKLRKMMVGNDCCYENSLYENQMIVVLLKRIVVIKNHGVKVLLTVVLNTSNAQCLFIQSKLCKTP